MNYRVLENYEGCLPSPEPDEEMVLEKDQSILLIRLSAIGDAVRLLPTVRYLSQTGFTGPVDIATQPPIDELLNAHPSVRTVHPIHREHWPYQPIRLIQNLLEIRDRTYDWVFDAHGLLKSAAVSRFARAKTHVGFHRDNGKEGNFLFQDRTIQSLDPEVPRILKYASLPRQFREDKTFKRSHLGPVQLEYTKIDHSVETCAEKQPLLIHPRTSHARYGTAKEWDVSKFRELIRTFLDRFNRPIRVTWGPGERETAQKISDPFGEAVNPSPETPDLLDLAYLIDRASLIVSLDTGPCHLADVLGTPLVALFGSSDHRVSGPLLTNYRLITTRGTEQETEDIPVDRVSRATKDLLRELDLLDSPE